ncbi:RDD family protein [Streptomyces triculaminicus]|uniref:RDD family protein n=1 Tax=Streptomyces triculaminicus TaxID=2816232 RepID=UPI0037D077F7
MSAPISGSADSSPASGYYPDPSIPGYIRYWSGTAWVPGTSRPAPAAGEPMPAPPAGAAPAPLPALAAPVPPTPRAAVRQLPDETGPVFLDEEPRSGPERAGAAPAWQADTAHQEGFGGEQDRRVSWGGDVPSASSSAPALPAARDPRAAEPPAREATPSAGPGVPGQGTLTLRPKPHGAAPGGPPAPVPSVDPRREPAPTTPATPRPQTPQAQGVRTPPEGGAALPVRRPESAPVPVTQPQPVGWAQQVQQLAQQGPRPGAGEPAPSWKPPKDDPFLSAAQAQGRPAGLGRRLAARLLDTLLLGGVVGAVAVPLWGRAVDHIDAKVDQARQTGETVTVWLLDGTTGGYLAVVLAVLLIGGVLYEALPTAKWGRTVGKKLCGVRVLDIESHETPSMGAALRRWLLYGVLGVLGVGALGVLWCVFDRPWRQCWHDKSARTFVASVES